MYKIMVLNSFQKCCLLLWGAIVAVAVSCGSTGYGSPTSTGSPIIATVNDLEICPFCSAVQATFSDQIRTNHIVVIAKLTKQPVPIDDLDLDLPKAELEVVQVEKGKEFVEVGMKFQALLVGTYELGQEFIAFGVDPPVVVWSTPMKVNPKIVTYIEEIQKLPAEGANRLLYFQKHFEDPESVLAYDAYDEFAQASYQSLIDLKPKMDRKQLLAWIQNPDIPINRRRLYLTMLGVCGEADDADALEDIIRSGDRDRQAGLDALVASYLMLRGEKGLDLVDKELIENPDIDDLPLLSVRSALAFHSTESNVISKERLLVSLRKYLDKPKVADAVIPDLARLKDWTVIDKLVEIFKSADDQSKWVRVPVIQYLQVCPLDQAKVALNELKKIDPDSVKRATFLSDFNFDDEGDDGSDDGDGLTDDEPSEKPKSDKGGDLIEQGQTKTPVKVTAQKVPVDVSTNSIAEQRSNIVEKFAVSAAVSETPVDGQPMELSEQTLTSAEVFNEPIVRRESLPVLDVDKSGTNSTQPAGDSISVEPKPVGLAIFTIPMIASFAVFLLIWSVISGWFERLIF